ncbi:MAG: hypothetical protein ABI284_03340 [Nitrosospira sp.]
MGRLDVVSLAFPHDPVTPQKSNKFMLPHWKALIAKYTLYFNQKPVGLEGNRLKKRLTGSYFAAFSVNRTTIGLQNPRNLSSPSRFFAAIL